MTAGEMPSCHWLAGSCLGASCRFWHPACSGQRELNLLEGFAAWCAMAALDPEQRGRSVHDVVFQVLVTTAPPSLSRPLLRALYDMVGALPISRRERLLDDLTARDARVREAVGREGWMRFEDLLACGERELQSLLRRIDNDTLLPALKGAALPVRELFFGNMPHQAALREELELMGPLFVDEVLAAQRTILHALGEVRQQRP